MPSQTPTFGIQYPVSGDDIKSSSDPALLAKIIQTLAQTGENGILTYLGEQLADVVRDADLAQYQMGRRPVSAGSNLNTYFGESFQGPFSVISPATAATITNMPKNDAGDYMPTAFWFMWPYGIQIAFIYNVNNAPTVKWRGRTTFDNEIVDGWSEWSSFGGSVTSQRDSNVYQNHMAKRDAFIRARGGSIGTSGKAAVALRFDHNLVDFRDIVLPMLRARNLPWCQAVNTSDNQMNSITNGGISLATIQGWAINDGGEVFPHSHTHGDSSTDEAIWANVLDQMPIFAAQMPLLATEVFAPPGAGGTNWNGFLDTSTPEHFTSSYTGARAVLSNYAACAGYIPGVLRPLTGETTNGQTHQTLNVAAASVVTDVLKAAQDIGAGVQLFLHPNDLTRPEAPLTPAILTEILDWIAAERDAGRLVVLSPSGLLLADSGHSRRYNVLPAFGPRWTQGTGWTHHEGVSVGVSTSGIMAPSIDLTQIKHICGRVREVYVEARASSAASLRIGAQGSPSLNSLKTIPLVADGQWHIYRVPVTIPATATSMSVTLGRASGGGFEMRNPGLLSV